MEKFFKIQSVDKKNKYEKKIHLGDLKIRLTLLTNDKVNKKFHTEKHFFSKRVFRRSVC